MGDNIANDQSISALFDLLNKEQKDSDNAQKILVEILAQVNQASCEEVQDLLRSEWLRILTECARSKR